jgi:hypothetical protein
MPTVRASACLSPIAGTALRLAEAIVQELALQLARRDGSLRNIVACAGGSDPKDVLVHGRTSVAVRSAKAGRVST